MVLIGLLLIALVCLALGLVLASAGWLIGSLAASAAAAWVLWRGRDRIVAVGASPEPAADNPPLASAAAHVANSVATAALSRDAAVAETPAAADYARRRADELSGATAAQPAAAAAGRGSAAETELVDVEVWVIDGRPNYHTAHCGVLLGTDPETIPHSQAVEDGFTPCTLCDPDAHPERVAHPAQPVAAAAPAEATEPGDLREVWVVDSWPHYHAQGCARLAGASSEPIPFGQAVEDGFTACPACQPAVIEPAGQSEPLAAAAPVQPEPAVAQSVVPEPVAEPAEPAPVATQAGAPVAPPEPVTEPAAEPAAEPAPVAESEPAVAEPAVAEPAVAEAAPAAAAAEPAAAAARGDVWIVPGRPRFHVQGCMIIGDQDAVAVPLEQALDDGFKPCSLCEPAG